MNKSEQLIACLEGEIAKRDEVIVGLTNGRDFWREKAIAADDELAAIKAQEPAVDEQAAFEDWIARVCPSGDCSSVTEQWLASSDYADLYAAPVSGAKAQGVVPPIRFWFIGDAGQKKGSTLCKKSSRDGSLAFFETEDDATRAAKRHAGTAVYSVDYYKSAPLMMPERSNECGSDGELTYEAKAQDTVGEVVGWYRLDRPYEMTTYPSVCATWHKLGAPVAPLYAAPSAPAADAGVISND